LIEAPTAILTIENYASFNRQVREIEDGSLVVYTGGGCHRASVEGPDRCAGRSAVPSLG
jgi:hypothetical protein